MAWGGEPMSGLDELAAAAEGLVPEGAGPAGAHRADGSGKRRAVLGIAGEPGAGKSTFAQELVAMLVRRRGSGFAAYLPMDGFHLADAQLDRLGLRGRKGAPETFDADGFAALLTRVRTETARPVYAPGFERTLEQPLAGALDVPPSARLVVTEGNYLLLDLPEWQAVRAALDEVWWVETGEALRLERLVARHVAFGKAPGAALAWIAAVDERNAALVRAGRAAADRVVENRPDGWHPLP